MQNIKMSNKYKKFTFLINNSDFSDEEKKHH